MRKRPPPCDHHRSIGIGLLQGPTGGGLLRARYPCRVWSAGNDLDTPRERAQFEGGSISISQKVLIKWFQKVNPPKDRQIVVLIGHSKQ